MQLSVLFRFCLLLVANEAMKFYKCDVARALKEAGMDGYAGYSLGDWLCVIHYTSGYDTWFEDNSLSSSNRFGIFQIDSEEWCHEDCVESKKRCDITCSNLLDDDIRDDIACAKVIVDSSYDIEYWKVWRDYCYRKRNGKWLQRCRL